MKTMIWGIGIKNGDKQ